MNKLVLLPVALCFTTSCIREDLSTCPPLQIDVVVKDKNYANVTDADGYEMPKDESLPFKDFVSTLYYRICDVNTGAVIKEQTSVQVTGEAKTFPIELPVELPFGQYALTVWGNLPTERPVGESADCVDLYVGAAQASDIYVATDTINYSMLQSHFTSKLERTKGKLLVLAEQLPDSVNHAQYTVRDVYSSVTSFLSYQKPVTLSFEVPWQNQSPLLSSVLLAPSSQGGKSGMHMNFVHRNESIKEVWQPEDITLSMKRNKLTIVRYVYQKQPDVFDIYVLVDDTWEKVHGMNVD